ncbi:hypothetical protein ACLOJK_023709 [Asimina triloba]
MRTSTGIGTLTNISKEAVVRFLKKGGSRKVSKMIMTEDDHGKSNAMIKDEDTRTATQIVEGLISKDVVADRDEKGKVPARDDCHNLHAKIGEMDETDWVDGSVSSLDIREDHDNDLERELTIEFIESPSSAKRKVQRASAEDKVRHCVYMYAAKVRHIAGRGSNSERSFASCLADALESHEGSPEEKTNSNGSISHDTRACNPDKPECSPDTSQLNNQRLDSRATSVCNNENVALATKQDRGIKRKGDIEFEMQLEMALSATATATSTVAQCSNSNPHQEVANSSLSNVSSQFGKGKRIKTEDSPVFAHESSGAVWSRKMGPPMYWAEVFCNLESSNGRWVHVDAANAIIDAEQKVEHAAAACRRSLRYVVAFAGNGAKDVTRRYCMKWYTIASQRINSEWWDQVLAPLKQLESSATGCAIPLGANLDIASPEVEKLKSLEVSDRPEASSSTAGSSAIREHLPDAANLNQGFGTGLSELLVTNTDLRSPVQNHMLASRSSLEDMELDTKALTEPLPTNQLVMQSMMYFLLMPLDIWREPTEAQTFDLFGFLKIAPIIAIHSGLFFLFGGQ